MKTYRITVFDGLQNAVRTRTEEYANRQAAQEAAQKLADSIDGYAYQLTYTIDVVKDGEEQPTGHKAVRLPGAKYNVRRQSKSFTFRVDDEILDLFEQVQNKGRLINTLLRRALQRKFEKAEAAQYEQELAARVDDDERLPTLTDVYDERP